MSASTHLLPPEPLKVFPGGATVPGWGLNPHEFSALAGHTKGRVERAVRYIREGFFYGRSFKDISDLNSQLGTWLTEEANQRSWADDDRRTVMDVWREEKEKLLPLPQNDFPTDHIETLRSGKLPYVRFDLNDYSIPHQYVRRPVTVAASESSVRILDGDKELARHPRSYGRKVRVRNEDHFAGLMEERRRSKARSRRAELTAVIPELEEFYRRLMSQGRNGTVTKKLSAMEREYGAPALQEAVRETIASGRIQLSVLSRILSENAQRNLEAHQIDIVISSKPHIQNLSVEVPDLATYDEL